MTEPLSPNNGNRKRKSSTTKSNAADLPKLGQYVRFRFKPGVAFDVGSEVGRVAKYGRDKSGTTVRLEFPFALRGRYRGRNYVMVKGAFLAKACHCPDGSSTQGEHMWAEATHVEYLSGARTEQGDRKGESECSDSRCSEASTTAPSNTHGESANVAPDAHANVQKLHVKASFKPRSKRKPGLQDTGTGNETDDDFEPDTFKRTRTSACPRDRDRDRSRAARATGDADTRTEAGAAATGSGDSADESGTGTSPDVGTAATASIHNDTPGDVVHACMICGCSLAHMSVLDRQVHVNQCLDVRGDGSGGGDANTGLGAHTVGQSSASRAAASGAGSAATATARRRTRGPPRGLLGSVSSVHEQTGMPPEPPSSRRQERAELAMALSLSSRADSDMQNHQLRLGVESKLVSEKKDTVLQLERELLDLSAEIARLQAAKQAKQQQLSAARAALVAATGAMAAKSDVTSDSAVFSTAQTTRRPRERLSPGARRETSQVVAELYGPAARASADSDDGSTSLRLSRSNLRCSRTVLWNMAAQRDTSTADVDADSAENENVGKVQQNASKPTVSTDVCCGNEASVSASPAIAVSAPAPAPATQSSSESPSLVATPTQSLPASPRESPFPQSPADALLVMSSMSTPTTPAMADKPTPPTPESADAVIVMSPRDAGDSVCHPLGVSDTPDQSHSSVAQNVNGTVAALSRTLLPECDDSDGDNEHDCGQLDRSSLHQSQPQSQTQTQPQPLPPMNQTRERCTPRVSEEGGTTANGDMRPSFESMDVVELKKRMAHFGLRPGSKRMMVQKLASMWARMHDESGADCESAACAGSAAAVPAPASIHAPVLEQANLDPARVRCFIESDQDLHDSMLLHEEVDVPQLRARLDRAGIPCGSDAALAAFLRDEGAVVHDWKE